MRRLHSRRQRGIALMAFLLVVTIGVSTLFLKHLNNESGLIAAARMNRNAGVLNRAKQALIGYVAMQAANAGEDNPGALPCPEAAGYFDNPAQDGQAAGTCTLPKVGRFPWRTIGTDKLVDASGEPLWYVVSPGWASSNTVINSNTLAQLTVDGVANSAVALIIAPGPAFTVAANAASGCAARTQVRPLAATTDKWQDYLECGNATAPPNALNFVTKGPSASFNDQVLVVTADDIMPGIEAAIAKRIERQIAPVLRSMYNGGSWSGSSTAPRLPFAAQLLDPSASAMKGESGRLQGLLPLSYAETSPGSGTLCTAGVAEPRCDPSFVAWTGASFSGTSMNLPTCTPTPAQLNCSYSRVCITSCGASDMTFTLTATASNVGMAMRQLYSTVTMTNVNAAPRTLTGVLNSSDGSATITLVAQVPASAGFGVSGLAGDLLCGLVLGLLDVCKQETFSVPITLLADHNLLDSTATGSDALGWFLRNKWHEVAYYAVASGFAPTGAASCIDGSTCLTVAYHRNSANIFDDGKQRAILVLSGRSLTGASRPNGTITDWLEGANVAGTSFETRAASLPNRRMFNDRIAVLDSNP